MADIRVVTTRLVSAEYLDPLLVVLGDQRPFHR